MIKIQEIDFASLDPRAIGTWPLILRVGIVLLAALAGIFSTYFFYLSPQIKELTIKYTQEDLKRKEFKDKYTMAINLPIYEQQIDEITDMYTKQLKIMPPISNIPGLLNLITITARKHNVKIESIKLGEPSIRQGLYEEMHLDLSLVGTYHNIGRFLADVSKLPRLVTMHHFVLKPEKRRQGDEPGELYLTLTIVTYWQTKTAAGQASGVISTSGSTPTGAPGQTGAANPVDSVEVEMLPDTRRAPRSRAGSSNISEDS